MTGVRGVYVACVFFDPPTVLISFYSKNLSDLTLYLNNILVYSGDKITHIARQHAISIDRSMYISTYKILRT